MRKERLAELRRLLAEMGARTRDQLRRATQSLLTGDHAQGRHAIASDEDLDDLELRINDACIEFLALHAPANDELRLVVGAMNAVTELERIGDLAAGVAGRALEPGPRHPVQQAELHVFAAIVGGLVADSLDALERGNAELARRVLGRRHALLALEQRAARELLEHAAREPALLGEVFRLSHAVRALGRISRHAMRISEIVLYLSEGAFERPRRLRQPGSPVAPGAYGMPVMQEPRRALGG